MKSGRLARHEADLGFKPRPAVRWLSPPELARTGLRVLVAQVLTSFADSRETQAFSPQTTLDVDRYKHRDGHLWIDFVADLGDGFDATFTVASLLSQPELLVSTPDGGTVTLPKSQLVVMGGDQVYPTASSRAYEDRMQGPYRAASGNIPDAALLALPGNHDWYDGLTAFMRMFAQGASIGGWRTLQSRSYFTVKLQDGWWLVGLDSQLEEYLDTPQLDYFYESITTKLQPGNRPRMTPMPSTIWNSLKIDTYATGATKKPGSWNQQGRPFGFGSAGTTTITPAMSNKRPRRTSGRGALRSPATTTPGPPSWW